MTTRRQLLRAAATALLGLAAAPAIAAPNLIGYATDPDADVIGHGDFRYRPRPHWAKINRFRTHLNNCHEMVEDRSGRLIMLGDDARNNLVVFNKDGEVVDQWGHTLPGGHGLAIATEGEEEFLYLTECGWGTDPNRGYVQRHNGWVTKMRMDGSIVFTIGHPMTVGAYAPDMPYQPTEVAVAPNGDLYVADGYGSNYILQYDHRGRFIRKFGGTGNADPRYDLDEAHGVAVDTRDPAGPRLVVTSRQDRAFKFFTLDGTYLHQVDLANLQVCRPVPHGDNLYAGVCWTHLEREGEWWLTHSGFVTVLDAAHRVVSNPGGTAPVYDDAGRLQPATRNAQRTFYHGHDVCPLATGDLVVCQWNAYGTPPVFLERVP